MDLYAPRMGWRAVSAWLALRLAAERGDSLGEEDPASFVGRILGMPPLEAAEAIRVLGLYRLVQPIGTQGLRVLEPLPAAEFSREFGEAPKGPDGALVEPLEGDAAVSQGSPAQAEVAAGGEPVLGGGPMPTDVRGVVEWYQRRIGLMSDAQVQRLAEWVTERGMTTDVVALAIEQTARSAEYASFSYLEGVLRNWYNQGVRTWEDVLRRPHLSTVLNAQAPGPAQSGQGGAGAHRAGGRGTEAPPARRPDRSDTPLVGVPNADAYRPVDPERVKRWKELYWHGR